MFSKQREFNIISGETRNYQSERSKSMAQQRTLFLANQSKPVKLQKLGTAKDHKEFQYDYNEPKKEQKMRIKTHQDHKNTFTPSMMNYVSTNYNIINHKQQHITSKIATSDTFNQNISEVYRKSPLTGIIHAARLVAPNYHKDYAAKEANHEFTRKRGGLCQFVCDVEKGYGLGKYFRNRK